MLFRLRGVRVDFHLISYLDKIGKGSVLFKIYSKINFKPSGNVN